MQKFREYYLQGPFSEEFIVFSIFVSQFLFYLCQIEEIVMYTFILQMWKLSSRVDNSLPAELFGKRSTDSVLESINCI